MNTDLPPLPDGLRLIAAASPGLGVPDQVRAYARAAIAADRAARAEPAMPLGMVRYAYACEVTPAQRRAIPPALWAMGDALLVWANEGDLRMAGIRIAAAPEPKP